MAKLADTNMYSDAMRIAAFFKYHVQFLNFFKHQWMVYYPTDS